MTYKFICILRDVEQGDYANLEDLRPELVAELGSRGKVAEIWEQLGVVAFILETETADAQSVMEWFGEELSLKDCWRHREGGENLTVNFFWRDNNQTVSADLDANSYVGAINEMLGDVTREDRERHAIAALVTGNDDLCFGHLGSSVILSDIMTSREFFKEGDAKLAAEWLWDPTEPMVQVFVRFLARQKYSGKIEEIMIEDQEQKWIMPAALIPKTWNLDNHEDTDALSRHPVTPSAIKDLCRHLAFEFIVVPYLEHEHLH